MQILFGLERLTPIGMRLISFLNIGDHFWKFIQFLKIFLGVSSYFRRFETVSEKVSIIKFKFRFLVLKIVSSQFIWRTTSVTWLHGGQAIPSSTACLWSRFNEKNFISKNPLVPPPPLSQKDYSIQCHLQFIDIGVSSLCQRSTQSCVRALLLPSPFGTPNLHQIAFDLIC